MATSACRISSSLSPGPPGCSDDPDARAERELAVRRPAAGSASRASSRSATADGGRLVRALEQERELVAAQPRQRVARARWRRSRRSATCTSSWSPASWPRLSLTCLNPSRSTKSTASTSRERAGPGERLVEAVAEQGAVGEAGEAVVEGLPRELLLEADPLGDVARVEDDPADVAVVAQVGDVRLQVAPLLEAVARSGRRARGARRGRPPPGAAALIVGVHEAARSRRRAVRPRRGPASRVDRLADVAAAAVAEDQDEVGGRGDQAAEVRGLPAGGRDQGAAPAAARRAGPRRPARPGW